MLFKLWAASHLPIHVLTCSHMKSDLRRELDLVFQFLNVNANIHCALESPEGFDHRQKQSWQDKVAVFNKTQVRFLNNAIDEVQVALERKTGAKFDDFQAWKRCPSWRFFWFCFVLFCFCFCVPQLYLWGSPLLGEIFSYVTVFLIQPLR